MSLHLSPHLEAFIAASNCYDTTAFLDCFASDAMVRDEDHTHTGIGEIATWFADVSQKYRPSMRPTSVDVTGQTALLTAEISGTFDGSPISLCYRFTYAADKIETLTIGN